VAGTAAFAPGPETIVIGADGKPVAPGSGEIGRVGVGGLLPLGYHNDPDKTAATFVTIDGERYSLPGDFGTVDADGTVRLLGRGSLCINTGGEKVFAEEVEEVVKTLAGVHDAVCIGLPDDVYGERVAALVVANPGAGVTADAVIDHVRARLARFKA